MLIQIHSLSKSFGSRTLFEGVNLRVLPNERIALIGPNGAGKTTLLNIIAEGAGQDSGEIIFGKGVNVGYLTQDFDASLNQGLVEYVMSSSSEILSLEKRITELTEAIAANPEDEEILDRYQHALTKFEMLGGYSYESDARAILFGLGFKEDDLCKHLEEFSGGWRMRAALSSLLLQNPDVLLLDEPTNHLDLESVTWLEGFLSNYEGSLIIVSHDRAFINGVVNRVCDLSPRELRCYKGNYKQYLVARELYFEQQTAKREAQLKEIEHLNSFVERFRYKASKATAAQEKIRQIEKIKSELIELPEMQPKMHFSFPQPVRTGKRVIELDSIAKSYGPKKVYEDLNLTLYRGDKTVLVGPNGAGKSTLMKILAGVTELDAGTRSLGEHVEISYFSQHQLEILDPKKTVYESLEEVYEGRTITETRKLLGAFLFKGDDVYKKVSILSGGEKSRLALARMLAKPAPLICLDEPTNHLDMYALDVLAKALQDYSGSLILISHDRDLVARVANKVIDVRNGVITVYEGDYDYYLEKREQPQVMVNADNEPTACRVNFAKSNEKDGAQPGTEPQGKKTKEQKRAEAERRNALSKATKEVAKQLKSIESRLETLRKEQDELTCKMEDTAFYSDKELFEPALRTFADNKKSIEDLEDRWIMLQEELSVIENGVEL